jgi:molybdopterin synthase catalytic subunit
LSVSVQTEDFDISKEIRGLNGKTNNIGAIVSFIGQVRDFSEGSNIIQMRLEHYPGMTEKSLVSIEREARTKWNIQDVRIIHRFGDLQPADQIVLVIVASHHRAQAFLACEFIMDYLKTSAPFWKKEITNSSERWVESKEYDDLALERWKHAV